MKSYIAGLVLSLSLGLVFAVPPQSAVQIKEKQAIQDCNVTNPVYRDVGIAVGIGISSGERIKLSQEEKCFLFCILQKVKFLNENADIYNGAGLVNFTLHQLPIFAKYSDVLIAQVFQIQRSIKGIDDKCHKAYVAYHQFGQNGFILTIALGLQDKTHVKDKIINSTETGQPIDQELSKEVKEYLRMMEVLISSYNTPIENQPQSQSRIQT